MDKRQDVRPVVIYPEGVLPEALLPQANQQLVQFRGRHAAPRMDRTDDAGDAGGLENSTAPPVRTPM
jgi:hypothetical protein